MSSFYYERRLAYSASAGRPITFAVQRLIVATVIVFALQLIVAVPTAGFDGDAISLEYWFGVNPALLRWGAVWQLSTYLFLHGGILHLFCNMIGLYFFGPDVERILSTRQFFRFYFLCGAAGALLQFGVSMLQRNDALSIGASGAVLGVVAAYAVAYPRREIYLFPFPFPIYAWAVALLFFVLSLTADRRSPGTAWAAHAGGMICGFVYMRFAPAVRAWVERAMRTDKAGRPTDDAHDPIGEAVDNIFKFDEEKKRRK